MGNLTRISGSLIANYSSSITQTGSFGSLAVSDKVQGTLTLNSNLTGSLTSTGSFGSLNATHLNGILEGTLGPVANALISGSTVVNAPNISGSITSTGSFGSLVVVDKVQGNLTLGGNLLASGDLDIGSHGFRAATLTADGLTAGRVPFAGTAGLLSDDSDLTFSGDTLTATKISATQITATGDISTSGSIFAREFHTEFTSASVTFASGSNKFGDDSGDTHRVTGSLLVSGSITMAHGDLTVTDNLDIEGDVDINGTTNLDNTDIDGTLTVDGGNIVFNEDSADIDFRVEGNGDANLLFTEGETDRIGIGTNNPDGKLHIHDGSAGSVTANGDAANLVIESSATGADTGLSILSKNTRANQIFFGDEDDNDVGAIGYVHNGNYMFFRAATNEIMRISGSGKVGINTNNPSDELEVHGATAAIKIRSTGTSAGNNPSINFQSTEATGLAARAEISADDDGATTKGALIFKTRISDSVTEAMRIDGTGKVGIGTTNPTADLHVSGSNGKILMSDHGQVTLEMQTNDTAAIFQRVLGSTNTSDINGGIFMVGNDAANETTFHVNYGGGNSGNNYNRRLRLTSTSASFDNCKVGIGTTNPGERSSELLTIHAGTSNDGDVTVLRLNNDETALADGDGVSMEFGLGTDYRNAGKIGVFSEDTSHDKYNMRFFLRNTSNALSERMRIVGATGNTGIGTTSPLGKLHIHNVGDGSGGVPSGGDEDTLIVSSSIRHFTAQIDNAAGNFDSSILGLATPGRSGATAFNFLRAADDSEEKTKIRGDGSIQARNTTLQAFDYAEFFEVALTEHTASGIPEGITVALTGSKVIPASQSSEEPIGIVRPRNAPAIIGNSPWNHWHAKYKTTDYGAPIVDENLNPVVNPSYVSQSYTPREDRNEWVIVGLLGQIPITDGQPTGSSWRKMHNISPTASMWFVK